MATGDIGSVTSIFEFDTSYAYYPHIIHVAGNVYLIIYTATADKLTGKLITVNIINGQISEPANNTYQFIANGCEYPKIIHISGTTYCALFRGNNADVNFMTFTISDAGAITQGKLDDAIFATTVWWLDMQKVVTGVYVVLYGHGSGLAYAVTWSIAANGTLGASQLHDLTIVTADTHVSNLITVATSVFAFAHSTAAYALGHVQTFSVASNGTIGAGIDTLQFDDTGCEGPHIFHVAGDVYAVVYSYTGETGKVVTFTIASDGQIGASTIDDYVFETGAFEPSSVARVHTEVYAIAFQGPDGDGWIKTIKITPTGQITEPFISDFEFETDVALTPWIIPTSGRYYAIPYSGPDTDGFLKTVDISTPGAGLPHTEMIMGLGP